MGICGRFAWCVGRNRQRVPGVRKVALVGLLRVQRLHWGTGWEAEGRWRRRKGVPQSQPRLCRNENGYGPQASNYQKYTEPWSETSLIFSCRGVPFTTALLGVAFSELCRLTFATVSREQMERVEKNRIASLQRMW